MRTLADVLLRVLPALWAGMIVAISFIETPLKFRAPEITLERGLGIGRLVFHALNRVELVLATLLVAALVLGSVRMSSAVLIPLCISIGALLVQVFVIRPVLDDRLAPRLAGIELDESWHHIAYIVLEVAKLVALLVVAIVLARRAGNVDAPA